MFRCENCDQVSAPKEKQNKSVVLTRDTVYFEMNKGLNDEGVEVLVQGKELGRGFETVRELSLCKNCIKG